MTHDASEAQRQGNKGASLTPPHADEAPADTFDSGERLLTVQMVAERLAVSPRQLWRLCAAGKFPLPVTLGSRCKRWRVGDVDQFLRSLQPGADA